MLFLVYKIMGRMRGIYIMDITREKTMRIVNYIFAVLIILCIAVMLLPANYSVEYSVVDLINYQNTDLLACL